MEITSMLLNIICIMSQLINKNIPKYTDEDEIPILTKKPKSRKSKMTKERMKKKTVSRSKDENLFDANDQLHEIKTFKRGKLRKNIEIDKTKLKKDISIKHKTKISFLKQINTQLEEMLKLCEHEIIKMVQPILQKAHKLCHKMQNKALCPMMKNNYKK